MYTTRKMMEKLITPQSRAMSLNELATRYQESKNPTYFATAFYKLYNLIGKIHYDVIALNEQDVVSIVLDRLEVCLTKFNGSQQFSLFFANCLYRKLEHISKLASNKQKKNEVYVDNIEIYETKYHDIDLELFELNDSIASLNFNITQQMQVGLMLQGYNKVEIAELFNVSKRNTFRQIQALRTPELHDALNS
jgi:hypothetical protein